MHWKKNHYNNSIVGGGIGSYCEIRALFEKHSKQKSEYHRSITPDRGLMVYALQQIKDRYKVILCQEINTLSGILKTKL